MAMAPEPGRGFYVVKVNKIVPGNAMLQRHPVEKLHGDEGMTILLANVINRADVGMI